jgi:hypothetical protein
MDSCSDPAAEPATNPMVALNPRLAHLVSAFWAAFPDGPPPIFEMSSPWPEVASAASESEGFTWRTAPESVLDAVHDALPWLDAESFVYWLPGLLLDLVVDPSRAGMRGDSLILALTPPGASDLADDRRALDRSRAHGLFDEATHGATPSRRPQPGTGACALRASRHAGVA